MRIEIEKEQVIRKTQKIDEEGYVIRFSVFNNNVMTQLSPMTLPEIIALRDELSSVIEGSLEDENSNNQCVHCDFYNSIKYDSGECKKRNGLERKWDDKGCKFYKYE